MIQGLAVAALFAAVVPAHAVEVPIRYLPEPGFDQVVVRAVADAQPRDAFAGLAECEIVDARTYAPVPAAQAEQMLAPCVNGLTRRYGKAVRLERVATAPENSASTQVEGLALYVPEDVAVTSALMRDLSRGLALRQGKILGHSVIVRRGALPSENKPVIDPNASTRSALQQTVDSCMTIQVVRRIDCAEDFIAAYGRCIVNDRRLRVSDIRPAVGRSMGVTLQSLADEGTVRSLNGQIKVLGADGPVTVSVLAYAETVALR